MRRPPEHDLIVLTGASGVLGAALLRELSDCDLAVLRHRRAYQAKGAPALEIQGSLTDRRLGMGEREWGRLARRTRAVIHCGSVTNFQEDPQRIAEVNREGTRNMLELARLASAPFCYVSTAFVVQHEIGFAALDGYDDASPGRLAYLDSKRAAEEFVLAGGTSVIVRPSVILGERESGWIARRQGLHGVLRAFCSQVIPFIPFARSTHIDFLPQDVVAGAIGALVREGVRGGEFWLTAGAAALSAQAMIAICVEELEAVGIALETPRFLDREIVERLIVPAFLDQFSESERRRYANLFAGAQLFSTVPKFECSLPLAGHAELEPTPAMLRETLRSTVRRYCLPRGARQGQPAEVS